MFSCLVVISSDSAVASTCLQFRSSHCLHLLNWDCCKSLRVFKVFTRDHWSTQLSHAKDEELRMRVAVSVWIVQITFRYWDAYLFCSGSEHVRKHEHELDLLKVWTTIEYSLSLFVELR